MKVQKGDNMKVGGHGGAKSEIDKVFRREKHSIYKNISPDEKKLFQNTVVDAAKGKSAGSRFTETEKKNMNHHLYKEEKAGNISSEDRKDFKKLIEKLE